MTAHRLSDVLAATGGEPHGHLHEDIWFRRIERDSRQIQPGDLFIAVRGERLDGHDFVPDAAARGAAAALVGREWANAQADSPLPLIVVDEPVAALQRLAAAWRAKLDRLVVVGVTGSVGKTSAKEVIAAVLSPTRRVYRNPGNLNNEIGLPLSLLEVTPDTEVAVLEMGGAYAFGELALLADVAKPTIAVVTNVYPVHLERMGTIEAIAETKAELVDAVPPEGVAILNGDDPRVRAMAARCRGRVLTFGLDAGNDVRATEVETEALEGTSFALHLAGETLHVKVPLIGAHAVQLALAGIAVGHALGSHISEMLVGFRDPEIQVRLLVVPGPNGSRIVDDTHNASTPSVMSALGLLHDLTGGGQGRAIAVLGDMRELGPVSEAEHRIVGRRAGEIADVVVTYGDLARLIAEEARSVETDQIDGRSPDVTSFGLDQREELVAFLLRELREGDVVLLKGSRGLRMEEMVAALRTDHVADGGQGDAAAEGWPDAGTDPGA